MGAQAARRTIVVPPLIPVVPPREDEDGPLLLNDDQLSGVITDLIGTLRQVGGVVRIVADRREVSTIDGEPLYETVGYVVQWQAFAPALAAAEESAAA